jgi:hypothetical protein
MEEEMCLMDSCTINSVLRDKFFFQTLTKRAGNVLTIMGRNAKIVGYGRAIVAFFNGTQVTIEDALLYPDSTHTLISFRDIRKSVLHISTYEDSNEEFLLITKSSRYGHEVLERIPSLLLGLYYTYINLILHVAYKVNFSEC